MSVITLAITGASGALYGLRLLEKLLESGHTVFLLLSDAAYVVIEQETQYLIPTVSHLERQQWFEQTFSANKNQLVLCEKHDWFSAVASGSGAPKKMVVCPASGGTISAIASGASNNLIERAADVVLKEHNQLIIVPRETPYSNIHLENMLKLSRMGAVILPASPGFYHKPSMINDLVDFIVARIFDHLDLNQDIVPQWGR